MYNRLREYSSFEECKEALVNLEDTIWTEKNRTITSSGVKLWHKCYLCEKKLYILFHRENLAVSLFVEETEHGEHKKNDYFIPQKTKSKVIELASFYKTKYICQWLRDHLNEGYIELNVKQVSNILSRYTNQEHSSKMSLKDLQDWCAKRQKIPDDPDQLLTVEFHFEIDTGDFHLFVTTKRLLLPTMKTVHLCADTTYKIMWQGLF